MKPLVLAVSAALLLSSCAAYQAQHGGTERVSAKPQSEPARPARSSSAENALLRSLEPTSEGPLASKQVMLLAEIDKYREELRQDGKYNCCVKPACRQCALTAGECHCREVISANGPCCGECTQAWVEGRGDAPGIDREQVLEHLGCVRELYEKKTPEGMTPPGQKKSGDESESHEHHH